MASTRRSLALAARYSPASVRRAQVLRDGDIAFSPPLLPHKRQALQLINFPNAMKCILKFSERPWPADCHGIVCSDSFIPEMWMNQTTTPATPLPPGTPLPPQECVTRCTGSLCCPAAAAL